MAVGEWDSCVIMRLMNTKTTARDFFLQLGVTVTLYVSAVSLLTLLFQIINLAFPDALESRYYVDPYSTGMRWAIACLFIVFPLYLVLSWLANRDYRREPAKRELGIRKWLIFFTLFVAGVALAVDLITLINYFLGGEITIRFVLKVLAVLVVAAVIFAYYLVEVRREQGWSRSANRAFAWVDGAAVLGAIILGFVVMGSPFTVRLGRFDQQKVYDLENIQWQVIDYYQRQAHLPADLAALTDSIGGWSAPLDPQTGQPYDYRMVTPLSFELCADFNRESAPSQDKSLTRPIEPTFSNWEHAAGRQCFARVIDPVRYPVNKLNGDVRS